MECCSWCLVIAVIAVAVLLYLARDMIKLIHTMVSVRTVTEIPPNTVVLHQYPRAEALPSESPFCLKLETFLRIADIKYVNVCGRRTSAKGKMPWIEYNGEFIDDSQFCVEFLNKKLDIDRNKNLSAEQKAVYFAFLKMIEENLFWYIPIERWLYKSCPIPAFLTDQCPRLLIKFITWNFKRRTEAHGIGLHSHEELVLIMEQSLTAISVYLGKKKYMFGDEPTTLDCTVFGFLCQFQYTMSNEVAGHRVMTEKLPNLVEYCDRIKARYYPDWDNLPS